MSPTNRKSPFWVIDYRQSLVFDHRTSKSGILAAELLKPFTFSHLVVLQDGFVDVTTMWWQGLHVSPISLHGLPKLKGILHKLLHCYVTNRLDLNKQAQIETCSFRLKAA
jgi:hypothetical protein